MSIEEVSAEKLAELFHHYHHTLGAHHNGTTGVDAEGWEQMPQQERSLLVAAARLTYLRHNRSSSFHRLGHRAERQPHQPGDECNSRGPLHFPTCLANDQPEAGQKNDENRAADDTHHDAREDVPLRRRTRVHKVER
jgi:hypothetical protein